MRDIKMEFSSTTHQWILLLMILKALDMYEQMHAYGLARIIEQMTAYEFDVHSTTTQKVLERLEEIEVVHAAWGLTEQRRRVRFYQLTQYGRRYFVEQKCEWEKKVRMIGRSLSLTVDDLR